MIAAFVETVKCNWCTRYRARNRVHRLQSGQIICENCLDWHFHALEFLGGHEPRGCYECLLTWRELEERTPGTQVRLYVVPKDGMLQLLCRACVAPYLPRRRELFEGTEFGREALKL